MSNRRKLPRAMRYGAARQTITPAASVVRTDTGETFGRIPRGYAPVSEFRPFRCLRCFLTECECAEPPAECCDYCASAEVCETCQGRGWHREGCALLS